jgi:RNA polymerase sigma-B factor
LLNAIDRFDVARGRAFSSFAVPTIADRARNDLETELTRSPTVGEIAQRLSIDGEDVVEALQAQHAKRSGSLDAPRRLEDDSGDTVGDHVAFTEAGCSQVERRADLWALARVLTPRERLGLRLRFERDLTQQEIGDRIGISQMQVSRILRSSIERLRDFSEQQRDRAMREAA